VTPVVAAEDSFTGAGGRRIFSRTWSPETEAAGAVVAIAHGFGEHSGRYGHVAQWLTRAGHPVIALDHHGHGRSEGPRARIAFGDAVADLDRLIDGAASTFPGRELFLLGHSMGGAIALRYAIGHGDRLAGLILSGALAEVEGRAAVKAIGRMLGALAPALPLAKLDPALVSRDPEVVRAYVEDPLVHHHPVPAGTVAEFLRHADSLPDDVGAITVPTLIIYGTADRLCAPAGSVMLSQRIGAADLTLTPYEGLYHEILNEPEQAEVLEQITGWITAHTSTAAAPAGARDLG
jgi:alpha-beta hydrolase superfamily lysophospholipase